MIPDEILLNPGQLSEAEYDTRTQWEYRAGLTYLVNKNFSLIGQYHSDYGPGAGLQIRF